MAPPKTEPTNEIELTSFSLPANVTTRMAESSIQVGSHFNTGMGIGAIVERIVYIGGGAARVFMGEHRLLIFATGALAVEKQS